MNPEIKIKGLPFELSREELEYFCKWNRIRWLALLGSVLRDDFRADSDIDVLVEFEPADVPGFLGLAHVERELSELFGRRVDLRTTEDLSSYFRDDVLDTAEALYG